MQLDGKVALVTGGGSGIGASIARRFAEAGARVAVVGRRAAQLRATCEAVTGAGIARPFVADIADRQQVARVVKETVEAFGAIDILVNNAGVNVARRRVAELSPDDWDEIMAVNATGAFNMVHAVLPLMRARRDGLIISISSTSGLRPSELGGAAYSASKHALTALTRVIGLEEGASGIRATAISPGEVDTPILDRRPTPVSAAHRASILQPDDIAAAALFVASLPPRACVPELVIKPTTQPFA